MEQLKKAGAAATEADLRSLLVESLEAGRSMQIELAAAMASTAEQATRIAVLEAEKGHTVHGGSEMTARRALTVDMDHAALQRQQYHQVRLRQTLSAMFPAPPEAQDPRPTFFWHRLYAIFHLPHTPPSIVNCFQVVNSGCDLSTQALEKVDSLLSFDQKKVVELEEKAMWAEAKAEDANSEMLKMRKEMEQVMMSLHTSREHGLADSTSFLRFAT